MNDKRVIQNTLEDSPNTEKTQFESYAFSGPVAQLDRATAF